MIAWVVAVALGAAPAQFVWPKPELVEEIDVPDVIRTDGVPVRLHIIRSKVGVQQMLQLYATAFDNAGFYIANHQKRVVAEPHITALDIRTKISYSAIISPNADGTTSVLLGEAALGKKKPPSAASDFAPLMPAAIGAMRIDQEADRVITFTVKATVDEVNQFYREVLPTNGFAAAPSDEGEANLYGKGNERIRVVARANANGTSSVVLMHRRSDR